MSKIRGALTTRELDRRTWSQVERLQYEVVMRGSGEYLMEEPIYFGRAYSNPPNFSYSAAADGGGDDSLVRPHIFTPPTDANKHLDAQGVSTSTLGTNNWIQDPGFEVQGQWIGTVARAAIIPDVHAYTETWNSQYIFEDYVSTVYYPREPYLVNRWIQTTDTNSRWSVSSDKAHDLGLGYVGEHSAKYVFGNETSSNWLIPIQVSNQGLWSYPNGDEPSTDEWWWHSAILWPHWNTSYAPEGFAYSAPPPHFDGFDGFCHVWSDSDCELELYSYEWDFSGSPFEDEYPEWDPTLETDIRIRNEHKQTFTLTANTWNKIEYHFPYTNRRSMTFPYQPWTTPGDSTDYNPSIAFWTWRYRINGGSPGQVVHMDNIYVWPTLRNVSMPIITIGVAEWITDRNDEFGQVYIGAKLWFKVGVA